MRPYVLAVLCLACAGCFLTQRESKSQTQSDVQKTDHGTETVEIEHEPTPAGGYFERKTTRHEAQEKTTGKVSEQQTQTLSSPALEAAAAQLALVAKGLAGNAAPGFGSVMNWMTTPEGAGGSLTALAGVGAALVAAHKHGKKKGHEAAKNSEPKAK